MGAAVMTRELCDAGAALMVAATQINELELELTRGETDAARLRARTLGRLLHRQMEIVLRAYAASLGNPAGER